MSPLIITGFGSYTQSKSILSKKLMVTSTQTLTEINNGLSDYFNGFCNMISIAANNYNIVNVDTDDNIKYIPEVLKGSKESKKDILAVYYGSVSGKYANYPVEKMPDNFKTNTRTWYKQALQNKGKVVITAPYKDVITGNNVVLFIKTDK